MQLHTTSITFCQYWYIYLSLSEEGVWFSPDIGGVITVGAAMATIAGIIVIYLGLYLFVRHPVNNISPFPVFSVEVFSFGYLTNKLRSDFIHRSLYKDVATCYILTHYEGNTFSTNCIVRSVHCNMYPTRVRRRDNGYRYCAAGEQRVRDDRVRVCGRRRGRHSKNSIVMALR